ncbi:MAG: MurT ligase domain-containing protein [Solirubrobacteraceae bacterium]
MSSTQHLKPRPRRAVAVDAGKATRWLSRRLGRGGGTNYPGLVTQRIDPAALRDLAAAVPNGCVFVTGTNGKTTTTRILADAMRRSGLTPLTNREGSNMTSGVATALIAQSDVLGTLRVDERTIGIFEVDEGHLLPAVKAVQPRLILFTNLLRDQLDRYFELDWTVHLWREALAALPQTTTLVLNADDPQIAYLGDDLPNPVLYYGVEDSRHALPELEHVSDSRRCLRCGADLQYQSVFYAHLGHYSCPACGWTRPNPRVSAWRVDLDGLDGSRLETVTPGGALELRPSMGGLYNAYNALAATAACSALGVGMSSVAEAVASAPAAFGRLERITVEGKEARLALVKNPSGYNEVLRLLLADERSTGVLLALNDDGPDGRDVSWMWDVDLERCRDMRFVICSGRRAPDLALRLKYAELARAEPAPQVIIEPDINEAFKLGLGRLSDGEMLCVLPTYTAMWELRETLAKSGHLPEFWRS